MEITDLIAPEGVVAALPANDKPQLMRELSRRASRHLPVGSDIILGALQAREALGSTGVGQGIAVPHARIVGLRRFFGLFAQLQHPIDFDAIDGQPVDLVFLLLIPDRTGSEHLAALAAISRRLRKPDMAAKLRAVNDRSELYESLTSAVSTRPQQS